MQHGAESTLNKLTIFKIMMETQHPLQSLAEICARIYVISGTLESNETQVWFYEMNAIYSLVLH